KKRDGTFFTSDELKKFESNRGQIKSRYNSKTAGITYAQLISSCAAIDIKRANNAVNDGSGIKSASFIGMEHNVAIISVVASNKSKDSHHRVKIRFDEWDDALESASDRDAKSLRIIRSLCSGRISFDCDCGRHKYWYRYIATAGNFALSPPKEYIYPKILNPNLKGLACKHVIHSVTRMQAGSWQMAVGNQLNKNAKATSFGDDKKRTTAFFTDDQIKKLNRNRKGKTDQSAAINEYERYQRQISALDRKLKADPKKLERLRAQLGKSKKLSDSQRNKLIAQKEKIAQLDAQKRQLQQELKDALEMKRQLLIDAQIMKNKASIVH
ncbi:MAG: phage tail protein, partial [Plesiomonas sp.]|uniref:phage tail protein n=1 Tax=Plesiomonas sp. TaxID=2486279 RepID=UPI003F2E99AC